MIIMGYFLTSCGDGSQEIQDDYLFESIDQTWSKVEFVNRLDYKEEFNIYRYRNFYNGGGVGLSDINNDGLLDIYFTSNMHENSLYLNKGNFIFEDITEKAGVGGKQAWSTGVSMADIHGDGLVDIYVCNSGDMKGDNKKNELFINNGDLTFTESAEEYKVADQGFSTHAAFFDYDKDGDIDLYLLNNSYEAIGSFNLEDNQRHVRDVKGGDKLLRNDGNTFTDVSVEAGIFGSVIAFGLGVTVGDINMDGWEDIYVSNDFFERDYIYINNQDGTFEETLTDMMRSISAASMGADMADINNDRYPEIFVTDMIPEFDDRLKTKTTFDSWDNYFKAVSNDYHHQFTRNMFHYNNGNGTFSEIGRLANVFATDWSWGALIFDMDNDGLKDLFVANGIYQDLTDQDYLAYFSNREVVKMIITDNKVDYKKLIMAIPSVKISNYAFRNNGELKFENRASEWGLGEPSHSNGSAYGDLDNDGDMDLVINNVNMPAFVFRNHTREKKPDQHYLKFILQGSAANTQAIGTKITLHKNDQIWYLEQMPVRGFQSSVDPRPNFGLGDIISIDSAVIIWPDGNSTLLRDVQVDQTISISQSEGNSTSDNLYNKEEIKPLYKDVSNEGFISFQHEENEYVDFYREKLIYHMLSTQGPKMDKGDVNGDGLEDFYIGGAKGFSGALMLQRKNGEFYPSNVSLFEQDKLSEDIDVAIFDADSDQDLDIYVASGGTEFSSSSSALWDRLYINDGAGNFSKSKQILPVGKFESTSCVQDGDFNQDGYADLFVGVRVRPFLYGVPVNGYILQNDGKGNFQNVSDQIAPELKEIGMITDMSWSDVDNDKDLDIVIVGEWMPVTVLINENGKFINKTAEFGLSETTGWWNCLASGDFDHDGDIDFVAGNHGMNSRFKASAEKPVSMYINDFDVNGSVEQVLCYYNGDTAYPMALKHDLVNQIPPLKEKYSKYVYYQGQTIEDIFTPEQIQNSVKLEVNQLKSSLIMNNGDGTFSIISMPLNAQLSPVYSSLVEDFNSDGHPDIMIGGNLYKVKPEVGRYDASYGLLLIGRGDGTFEEVPTEQSGIRLEDEVRDLISLKTNYKNLIIASRNNERIQVFQLRKN
jgi:hypothetical protein